MVEQGVKKFPPAQEEREADTDFVALSCLYKWAEPHEAQTLKKVEQGVQLT